MPIETRIDVQAMSDPKPTSRAAATDGGWLQRHPGFVPMSAAAAFLGLFQAVALAWRYQGGSGGWLAALGMGKLGLFAGLLTVLLLAPVVLWLRRARPQALPV